MSLRMRTIKEFLEDVRENTPPAISAHFADWCPEDHHDWTLDIVQMAKEKLGGCWTHDCRRLNAELKEIGWRLKK